MKLTVLGKYGPYPAPGGACSGYLIEEGDTRILLDCGNGVISRLQQVCDIKDINAVILSHLHSDHMSDMMVLRYALDIMVMRGLKDDKPLTVYAPENPVSLSSQLPYKNVYDVRQIRNGMMIHIGSLTVKFQEMTHPVQSFGVDISNGNKRLVYTGDTNYNPEIVGFARGADLFLADTGLLEKHKSGANAPHLTAAEVGQIAENASVKQLMLTHLWPGYDEEEIAREAAQYYPGLKVAQEMHSYEI